MTSSPRRLATAALFLAVVFGRGSPARADGGSPSMVEAGLRQSVLAVRVEHALNRHGTIYKLRVNIKYAKDAIPAGGSERMEKKLAAMLAKERKLRDALRPSVRKKLLEELRQRLGP